MQAKTLEKKHTRVVNGQQEAPGSDNLYEESISIQSSINIDNSSQSESEESNQRSKKKKKIIKSKAQIADSGTSGGQPAMHRKNTTVGRKKLK